MYGSMIAGTHLPPQLPKVARLCQYSRMACNGLIAIFSVEALYRLLVLMRRSRGSKKNSNGLFESQT